MSKPSSIYMVLYPNVTREDFEKAAADLGFVQHETRPGDGARRAYEQVWATPDRTTAVNYLEDPLAGMNYLCLRGAHLDNFEPEFAERLDNYSPEEVLELAAGAKSHDKQVASLFRIAITFPEYEPEAFRIVEAYATQPPDPLLREAAVDAMGFRGWPEFVPLLERIAAQDPAVNVRQHAQEILSAVRAESSGAP